MANLTPTIHVRTKRSRYAFDGQTGVVVLAGTTGTIAALTLGPDVYNSRDVIKNPVPSLTVYWDAAILQDRENNEPSTYAGWEESGIRIDDVEFVNAVMDEAVQS